MVKPVSRRKSVGTKVSEEEYARLDTASDCLCQNPLAALDHRFNDIKPGYACSLPWYEDWLRKP